MKTGIQTLATMLAIGLLMDCSQAQAQHGRRDDHHDQNTSSSNYQNRDRSNNDRNNDNRRYDDNAYTHHNNSHDYDRRDVYYNYQYRNNYGTPPWAYHQHAYPRTRYIYFKDSGVYYDCNNSTYITISGRNWSVSSMLPESMCRMNMDRITYENVNYVGDNVYEYHTQRCYNHR